MSRLEEAVIAVARFLERHRVPYMVIGGVANAIWGVPRATLDVDLTVWVPEEMLPQIIGKITQTFPARTENPVAFVNDTRVLPVETTAGIRIDIIFGQLPYESAAIQRAARHTFHGVEVRVCQPEDLILHKIISERSKDREDIQEVIRQCVQRLDRCYLDPKVEELAKGLDRPDIRAWYERCLSEAAGRPRVT